jgi:hypothetical protein
MINGKYEGRMRNRLVRSPNKRTPVKMRAERAIVPREGEVERVSAA